MVAIGCWNGNCVKFGFQKCFMRSHVWPIFDHFDSRRAPLVLGCFAIQRQDRGKRAIQPKKPVCASHETWKNLVAIVRHDPMVGGNASYNSTRTSGGRKDRNYRVFCKDSGPTAGLAILNSCWVRWKVIWEILLENDTKSLFMFETKRWNALILQAMIILLSPSR